MQEIAVDFIYHRQQKMKNFHLRDGNGKLWVEMFIDTSLNVVATVMT